MRADLVSFMRDAASRDFKYGEFDCGLWLADWYMAATGKPDPAAHLRGIGRTDLVRQVRIIVRRLQLPRVQAPIEGDIGIISLAPRYRVGAIFGGDWIVLAKDGGLSVVSPDSVKRSIVWRMP